MYSALTTAKPDSQTCKTGLVLFSRPLVKISVPCHTDGSQFWFCGQILSLVDSVLHLGNTLRYDLSDKLDIQLKTMTFIRQANSVLFCFKAIDPPTKMRLFHAYCLALYGCSLWRLDCPDLHSLNVSFNNVLRRIWNLPRNCHTGVVHSVGLISSIYNIVFSRFCRLRSSALSHPSPLVRSIFAISSQTCNSNFIGYNCLFGSTHCKSYTSEDIALGQLIREIRCTHFQIDGFSSAELDSIVSSASSI